VRRKTWPLLRRTPRTVSYNAVCASSVMLTSALVFVGNGASVLDLLDYESGRKPHDCRCSVDAVRRGGVKSLPRATTRAGGRVRVRIHELAEQRGVT